MTQTFHLGYATSSVFNVGRRIWVSNIGRGGNAPYHCCDFHRHYDLQVSSQTPSNAAVCSLLYLCVTVLL